MKAGKFIKTGARMTCSNCKIVGHNIKKCPQKEKSNVASSQVQRNENVRSSATHDSIGQGIMESTSSQAHHPTTQSMASNSMHGQPSKKRKRVAGISLYTNLKTGEQIFSSGLGSERVVTPPTTAPKKIRASTSQFDHTWKGPGLSWKGKKATTIRQLQHEHSDTRRKHPQTRMTQ